MLLHRIGTSGMRTRSICFSLILSLKVYFVCGYCFYCCLFIQEKIILSLEDGILYINQINYNNHLLYHTTAQYITRELMFTSSNATPDE